jgi:hypothetical protein
MGFKSVLFPDHIKVSHYTLDIAGMPSMTFTMVGGPESELDDIEQPDRTRASGGRSKPGEIEVRHPAHHALERAALEAWWLECKHSTPGHKRVGTFTMYSQSGLQRMAYVLLGAKLQKRALPDGEMENDGEQAEITWTITYDDVDFLS